VRIAERVALEDLRAVLEDDEGAGLLPGPAHIEQAPLALKLEPQCLFARQDFQILESAPNRAAKKPKLALDRRFPSEFTAVATIRGYLF
jgi:hypothetical protein